MKAGRKLVYGFLTLPHHQQLDIFMKHGLTTEDEIRGTKGHEEEMALFTKGFKRAKEQGKLNDLILSINAALAEIEEIKRAANPPPPAPPKPKFKITPHESYDKQVEFIGPDDFRFFVDNDDVDMWTADRIRYLLVLLNQHWNYIAPEMGDEEP